MKNPNHTTSWNGLDVQAIVIVGDTEGDESVPGGLHHIPPYVAELEVYTPKGADMLDYLTETAQEAIEEKILNEFINKW